MLVTPARPVQCGCLSACVSSRRPGSAGPVPCALCPRRDDAACSVFECVCPGPGTGSPWSAAGVLCSTRGKQDGDLCPPGTRATPFLTSGSGQPGVRRGWRLEQRLCPGPALSCPRGQASPMSTEAEGWSRDHGPGLALSCPRACYGHSVGTRSQTGLGLRRETQVSPGGSRSRGRQGRGATKAAAGGSQRGVSPHRCPSQTPCPGTQRMPPCRCLKTQCPEERSLEMPASSRQVQAGDPLPSRQTWSGLGLPGHLGLG